MTSTSTLEKLIAEVIKRELDVEKTYHDLRFTLTQEEERREEARAKLASAECALSAEIARIRKQLDAVIPKS